MGAFQKAEVARILEARSDLVRTLISIDGQEIEAVGFPQMLAPVAVGDSIIVNMTGIELGLGTGGVAFILWNLDGPDRLKPGEGHIVKMRYTPWQTEVLSAEAPESPHHELLETIDSIAGMPVVVCGLHSQVGAAAAGIRVQKDRARIGYLMTDAAALPLPWSRTVSELRRMGLLDMTCTAGHAFGGDIEAVNVFSGLAALRHAGEMDAVVVAMGPGVVGTDTTLGFSALEQGQVLDAVTALKGSAVAALRISFADHRARHLGVSHHTLTALTIAARERCRVAVPKLPPERLARIVQQLEDSGVSARHDVRLQDGAPGLRLLAEMGLRPSSMGRTLDEMPELFVSASAAGGLAAALL